MGTLLVEPLFYILFLYGVSFLLMAYLIARGARRAASVPLVSSFSLLALFGLTHGITEMLDWITLVVRLVVTPSVAAWVFLSRLFLVASFVILLQFGVQLLVSCRGGRRALRFLPAAALGVFLVVVFVLRLADIERIGLLGRYCFGFSGAAVSSAALFTLSRTIAPLGNRRLARMLTVAGAGFACYAVFGGLIVKPIAGVPVQLFRSACAITIALSVAASLDIFQYVTAKGDQPLAS